MSAAGRREFRVLVAFAAIGFALAGVITLALSGGGPRTSVGAGVSGRSTPIERAAYVTSAAPGYKFAIDVTGSALGRSFTVDGTGWINPGGRGSLQMSVAGVSISEVFVYPEIYIRTPALPSGASLAPTPWIKASLTPLLQSAGASSSVGSNTDPSQMVDYLKSSGAVAVVGGEWVRGVPTTHYHALVDLDRYPSVLPPSLRGTASRQAKLLERMTGQSTLPVDVWIDGSNRVRRLAMQMSLCSPVGTVSESFQMDLYDYGRQPPVHVPAASEVTDLTSQLSSHTTQALQQLHCS